MTSCPDGPQAGTSAQGVSAYESLSLADVPRSNGKSVRFQMDMETNSDLPVVTEAEKISVEGNARNVGDVTETVSFSDAQMDASWVTEYGNNSVLASIAIGDCVEVFCHKTGGSWVSAIVVAASGNEAKVIFPREAPRFMKCVLLESHHLRFPFDHFRGTTQSHADQILQDTSSSTPEPRMISPVNHQRFEALEPADSGRHLRVKALSSLLLCAALK